MSLSLAEQRKHAEAALLRLAKNPIPGVDRALRVLVPHLHPDDAAMRFGALREVCADQTLMVEHARAHPDEGAAALAAEYYWAGLVQRRLGEMFTPTMAFNDDRTPWTPGSQWNVPAVPKQARAVAA